MHDRSRMTLYPRIPTMPGRRIHRIHPAVENQASEHAPTTSSSILYAYVHAAQHRPRYEKKAYLVLTWTTATTHRQHHEHQKNECQVALALMKKKTRNPHPPPPPLPSCPVVQNNRPLKWTATPEPTTTNTTGTNGVCSQEKMYKEPHPLTGRRNQLSPTLTNTDIHVPGRVLAKN